jgi:cobyrinic acid a,c-diamide synthase
MRARGLAVQTFKKGPDFIDPMWLTQASGRRCRNLDPYLTDAAEIRASFARHAAGADVALVEGNKGLYDGLALDGSNSNAAVATMLDLPVALVIDARGMTRGIAPLILGYQAFDRDIRIAGVILNQLGGSRHEAKLRAVIEHYTDVPVLGAVHHDPALAIVERQLGLMPCNEAGDAAAHIAQIGAAIARQVDIDRLLAAAADGPSLVISPAQATVTGAVPASSGISIRAPSPPGGAAVPVPQGAFW